MKANASRKSESTMQQAMGWTNGYGEKVSRKAKSAIVACTTKARRLIEN
jgi:hypothetical protein